MQKLKRILAKIIELELWILGGLAAISVFWHPMQFAVVGVSVVLLLLRLALIGRVTAPTPVDPGVFLLVVMAVVSLNITVNPSISYEQVFRLLTGIVMFYAVINWCSKIDRVRNLVNLVLLSGIGLTLIVPFNLILFSLSKNNQDFQRTFQFFPMLIDDKVNVNVMGGILAILIPVAFARIFIDWKKSHRFEKVLVIVVMILMLGFILVSQSRGALLGLGISFLLMTIMGWRSELKPLLSAIFSILVLFVALASTGLLDRILETFYVTPNADRVELWKTAIYMIEDFPLTGVGMGNFMHLSNGWYDVLISAPERIEHTHNLYLQIGVDLGIPGLIAWLSIAMSLFYLFGRVTNRGKKVGDKFISAMGLGMFGALVVLMVHGIFDAAAWGMIRTAPLIWVLWGIGVATFLIVYSTNENANTTISSQ